MKEQEIQNSVLLSVQRALLGVITPNIRMITIGWEGINRLHILAYYDKEPTEEDVEDMNSVCAEIEADVPFEKDKVECLYSNTEFKNLKVLKFIVYSRKGG